MAIKIVTDSTAYLPTTLLKELDIQVVSLNIIMDQCSAREVEIDLCDFYENLATQNTLPTSSQPSLEEFFGVFKRLTDEGHEVIGIFLSSKMSGTYSSAHLVKEMVLEQNKAAKIHIIDSLTNCMQMGLMVIEAAKAAQDGASSEEIIELVEHIKQNSRFLFTPQTLDYLQKGGRIGGASALLGNLLQIKPVLTVQDGVTSVFSKVRTKKKAILAMIEQLKKDLTNHELGGLVVHNIYCEEEGLNLANHLEKEFNCQISNQSIGPVIGCHVGPGGIGIAYFVK